MALVILFRGIRSSSAGRNFYLVFAREYGKRIVSRDAVVSLQLRLIDFRAN